MKYASEDLVNEHEGILFGLTILERMAQLLKQGKPVIHEDLREMVDFFKLFADKCHHGKEEGMLFPALEAAGVPRENGPIGQMLVEHVEGRKHIAAMNEAWQGAAFEKRKFIQGASDYIRLLRAHIDKENRVLFPLGDRKIPMDIQTELLKRFEEHEEKVMGAGTHEKLHETLHEFEIKYLEGKAGA